MRKLFYLISSIVLLASCSTTQKATDNNEASTTWQDVLRMWSETYDINDDAQRMAVIDQIISVFDMIDDSTLTKEQLDEPICKLKEILMHIIETDSSFEFAQIMRATARNIAGRMPRDERLATDCIFDLMIGDSRWQTFSNDKQDLMYTSLFYNSWQALGRMANIILTKSDDNNLALTTIVVTNHIDTVMDNLRVVFIAERDTTAVLTANDDLIVYDNEDGAGIKTVFIPPYILLEALLTTSTITIEYDTPYEHIQMIGCPQVHFEEQVKDCPRLMAVMNEIEKHE